ncbi:MAG TPA: hypothetical protein VGO07_02275 [Candidatus Saccharimonadales bacterium]|jgi:hypothetical protein|nr:hypothetical protein [Candidatus Saccharimonadales bacterium]
MILHIDGGRWYIDVRTSETSDQISYDLTNHLPRRLAAGRVIITAHNTKVFLSVIRKRWMKLLYEVECQRSSTLDKLKKEALQFEADQMQACTFASKPPAMALGAQVYCLNPAQLAGDFPDFMTIYVVAPLSSEQINLVASNLCAGGLVVLYGPWLPQYEPLLREAYS